MECFRLQRVSYSHQIRRYEVVSFEPVLHGLQNQGRWGSRSWTRGRRVGVWVWGRGLFEEAAFVGHRGHADAWNKKIASHRRLHITEVAFLIITQQLQVWFPALPKIFLWNFFMSLVFIDGTALSQVDRSLKMSMKPIWYWRVVRKYYKRCQSFVHFYSAQNKLFNG